MVHNGHLACISRSHHCLVDGVRDGCNKADHRAWLRPGGESSMVEGSAMEWSSISSDWLHWFVWLMDGRKRIICQPAGRRIPANNCKRRRQADVVVVVTLGFLNKKIIVHSYFISYFVCASQAQLRGIHVSNGIVSSADLLPASLAVMDKRGERGRRS